ncbi:AsmA family protein, partial [Roseateles saccharophilus]
MASIWALPAVAVFGPGADRLSDQADNASPPAPSYRRGRGRPTPAPPARAQHGDMKHAKSAVAIGALLLLPALAAVSLDLAGWPGLAPRLAQRADLGLQLDAGARLHLLWRPRLEAPRLRLVAADGQTLADAGGVTLAWQWRDIEAWRHGAPLRLRLVQAAALTLDWRRDAAGRSPWPLQAGGPQDRPAPLPRIDHLVIRAGTAHLDDMPLQLLGDTRFETADDGRWSATLQGRLRGQQLALKAEASAGLALLSPPQAGLPPVRLVAELSQSDGRISFAGTATSLLDARALDGALHVQGRSLAAVGRPFGLTLPHTPPLALDGWLRHAAGHWRLDEVRARIGGSRLAGDFAFDTTRPARPLLSGLLHGGPLRLADLGPAIGTDTPPSRPGRVLPDRPLDLPALGAMDARVTIALSRVDLGNASLAPLAPVNASLLLEAGVLSLDNFSAGVAGGEVAGTARLDTRASPPQWQARADVHGLAVEQWLRPQLKGLSRQPLTGRLRAALDVQGHGRSTAELLGSLDGPLRLRLEHGSLSHLLTEAAGLDLVEGLGMWLRGDSNLPLDCALLDGRFRSGVLRPRSAVLDSSDSRIELGGRVSLADESLDLRIVTRPKDFSPLTLRTPLHVQGRLAAPSVTLEGRALGGRAAAAAALGVLAPPAALLAFVDPGEALPPLRCEEPPRPRNTGA